MLQEEEKRWFVFEGGMNICDFSLGSQICRWCSVLHMFLFSWFVEFLLRCQQKQQVPLN